MADDQDHRERRLADSSKLQGIITGLSKVPQPSRMLHVHDELMHAIDRCLATHKGHRFETKEIEVIKDVAFQIVYMLDPSNRPARGFFALWRDFKTLSALQKAGAIGGVLAFLGGAIGGSITLWEKAIRPSVSAAPSQVTDQAGAVVAPTTPGPKGPQPISPSPPPGKPPCPPWFR